MKLLEAVEQVVITDVDMMQRIYETLEDRRDVLEGQEPFDSSEFFYEKWEEKYNEFCWR